MRTKEYESKRKFDKTPEPRPGLRRPGPPRKGKGLAFVVHKHAARALHYDLRLEMEGALKSWAVPKGPSLNPSVKRLAVKVEDHPLEYKDFEGVIPEGNYGAGGVIIWDRGTYSHPAGGNRKESEKLLLEGLRKGDVKFVLDGKKLKGEFALVKTKMSKNSWLLMKKRDRYATTETILARNRSVVSHKTLEGISRSNPGKSSRNSSGKSSLKSSAKEKIDLIRVREGREAEYLKDAPVKPMRHGVEPMLATLVDEPFNHPDWMFEVKWDGYRAISELEDNGVSLYSRHQISLNQKYPEIVDSLKRFRFEAVLDGEIVVVDSRGHPQFQMLQDYQKSPKGHLLYYVFDVLYFEGHDLTGLPLVKRRELLKKILPSSTRVRFSDHVWKEGVSFFKAVKKKGLEGIIAKHSQSAYRMGTRSRQWLKVKTRLAEEAVIAGFTQPRRTRKYFGALVLGMFKRNELVYIGHTGTGFSDKTLKEIRQKLNPLIQKKSPFSIEPKTNMPVTWVKPVLVCEVIFQGWTNESMMRQPAFLRLREDKTAREVVHPE